MADNVRLPTFRDLSHMPAIHPTDAIALVVKGTRLGEFGKDPVGLFNLRAFAQGVSHEDADTNELSLARLMAAMSRK